MKFTVANSKEEFLTIISEEFYNLAKDARRDFIEALISTLPESPAAHDKMRAMAEDGDSYISLTYDCLVLSLISVAGSGPSERLDNIHNRAAFIQLVRKELLDLIPISTFPKPMELLIMDDTLWSAICMSFLPRFGICIAFNREHLERCSAHDIGTAYLDFRANDWGGEGIIASIMPANPGVQH